MCVLQVLAQVPGTEHSHLTPISWPLEPWGAAAQPSPWICLQPGSSVGTTLRHAWILASLRPRDGWCPADPFCSRWQRPYQRCLCSGLQRILSFPLGCKAVPEACFCVRCFVRRLVLEETRACHGGREMRGRAVGIKSKSLLSLLGAGLKF